MKDSKTMAAAISTPLATKIISVSHLDPLLSALSIQSCFQSINAFSKKRDATVTKTVISGVGGPSLTATEKPVSSGLDQHVLARRRGPLGYKPHTITSVTAAASTTAVGTTHFMVSIAGKTLPSSKTKLYGLIISLIIVICRRLELISQI